jgi:RsiW-degrading membrane proteinase PrsW (M82 family)
MGIASGELPQESVLTCPSCQNSNVLEGDTFCRQCGCALDSTSTGNSSRRRDYGAVAVGLLSNLGTRLSAFTSTGKLEGFSLREMFSETLRHRSPEEIEDYLQVGTNRTTPNILEVSTGWPKPWFFVRVFFYVALVYALFLASMVFFTNPKFIPGLTFMGSLAVPLAVLVLFFELNTPRNVSFYSMLTLIAMGGVLSLITSSIGYEFSFFGWLGAPQAGIIEEVGKLAAVIIICRQTKHKYILNGMLFGAAIGAGFAAFETAGYAQEALLNGLAQVGFNTQTFFGAGGSDYLHSELFARAWLAPFGHVVWTAVTAGALWRVKKDRPFNFQMLDATFWKTFLVPMACHMIWDSPLAMGTTNPNPLNYGVTLALGAISWYVAFGLVQEGLKQVAKEQVRVMKEQEALAVSAGPLSTASP